MIRVFALLMGALFGAGLYVAGMTNPAKVQGFLDITGQWDPSLIFVMAAGIPVAWVGYTLMMRRGSTVLNQPLFQAAQQHVDRPLVVGSVLFGAGWGLGGFCPGPGLASLLLQPATAGAFVLAMVAGMLLNDKLISR
ncbi:MAG: DUF6691 family protein [Litorivicinus sp.]